jgi:hypothetical protein
MECLLRYRGKDIRAEEVEFLKNLIAQNPALSRRALSTQLCQVWNWVQANGRLRSMVCRGMMLALHRAGHIQLPPVRQQPPNPLAQRRPPAPLVRAAWEPIQADVRELGALEIRQVRRTAEEQLFGSLIQAQHYLAYTQPVGEHLKHLVYARGTPIACLAWSSAPRHLGPRDRFIGWTAQERRARIHFLAYNTRFLVLPWAKVPGLASQVLSQAARVVAEDWQRLYHHPVYLLETFIDPQRFGGACYRAANWQWLGWTTGRGKDAPTRQSNRSLKQLWVLPLVKDFRAKLRQGHG